MRNIKHLKKAAAVLCAAVISFSTASCGNLDAEKLDGSPAKVYTSTNKDSGSTKKQAKAKNDSSSARTAEIKPEKEQPSYTCSLVCVGDNLIHDNIYKEALKLGDGTNYDFTQAYEHVSK